MAGKYTRRKHNGIINIILKISLFVIFSIAAIKAGTYLGDQLYKMDIKIVDKIDVEAFKSTLNSSFPLINTTYNSGNISISFSGEVRNLIKAVFEFDLNKPVTILNAQSPFLYAYYFNIYQPRMLQANNENKQDTSVPESNVQEEEPKQFKEGASSISIDEVEEKGKEIPESGMVRSGKIAVQNETKYKINIDQMLNEPLKTKFDKKGPKVLIYHTHTTEGYLDNLSNLRKNVPSWSEDPSENVVRVGEELAQILRKKYGIDVIHNATRHDYPSNNGAYGRSLITAGRILKSYPSIKVVIDIHRDGLGPNDGKLRAVTKVNNINAAQVMFVLGSDQLLSHPGWRENLKFAVKLQQRMNEIAPGLAKPIDLSSNRYNQHLSTGAIIIEVGGDGNLIGECLESTKYIAKAINDVVNTK